jgi:hypothetical protein
MLKSGNFDGKLNETFLENFEEKLNETFLGILARNLTKLFWEILKVWGSLKYPVQISKQI